MTRPAPRLLLAVGLALLAAVAGLATGLAWRAHQATQAEQRADRADRLYRAAQAQDSALAGRWRDSLAHVRDSLTRAAAHRDSLATARAEAIRRANRELQSRADSAAAALARAETAQDSLAALRPYPALLAASQAQFRGVVAQFDTISRAMGELRQALEADSVALQREILRGDTWHRAADSLHLAVLDLQAHRRPGFSLRLSAGSAVAGGVAALLLRALVAR